MILKHGWDVADIRRSIISIEAPAETIRTFLREHAIDHLNPMIIDIEGSDDHGPRMVCKSEVRPDTIPFEWVHPRPAGEEAASRRLVEPGYRYLQVGRDIIAAQPAAIGVDRASTGPECPSARIGALAPLTRPPVGV